MGQRYATDGHRQVFFELHRYTAANAVEGEVGAWIEVDLGDTYRVEAVELWVPELKCLTALKAVRPPRGKGKPDWSRVPKAPCDTSLLEFPRNGGVHMEVFGGEGGGERTAYMNFTAAHTVYAWHGVEGVAGRRVRISLRGGGELYAGEVVVRGTHATKPAACGQGDCVSGRCIKGVCVCKPNWIGSDCSTMSLFSNRYLPDRPHNTWWDEPLAAEWEKELKGTQAQCSGALPNHLLPGPGGMGAGFGSTMMYRMGDFASAMKDGKAYIMAGRANFAMNNKFCSKHKANGQFRCYFKDHAPRCQGYENALRAKFKQPSAKANSGVGLLSMSTSCSMRGKMGVVTGGGKSKGYLWYRALQTVALTTPNSATARELNLEGLKKEIGYQHPIIGLHARGGDGCRYGIRAALFKCRQLLDYLPDIRTMSSKYGTRRVFVATDSPGILKEAVANKEFEFVVIKESRSSFDSAQKIELRMANKKISPHGMMVSTLRDMYLLAEADYLVTHQASTLSRMALQLATAWKQHIPPYVSVDGAWCPHW
eukprot:CAMPEP_0182862748 /NCGR_PEP_ID=MMETSP0034_2-20130328/6248_1 /TAXON_ID=156128 /ORGANISM="Nephroselmis pyriformis, Strain CCMP717" /LENGTH=537 /DNA_ID=CAMNT_0024994863 /DNA_START=107 /DNA_END=1717 /DNA_ORIENTATION=-